MLTICMHTTAALAAASDAMLGESGHCALVLTAALVVNNCSSGSQGPGAHRTTVRSADEERKVLSCGCHRHCITLSQCSPATV